MYVCTYRKMADGHRIAMRNAESAILHRAALLASPHHPQRSYLPRTCLPIGRPSGQALLQRSHPQIRAGKKKPIWRSQPTLCLLFPSARLAVLRGIMYVCMCMFVCNYVVMWNACLLRRPRIAAHFGEAGQRNLYKQRRRGKKEELVPTRIQFQWSWGGRRGGEKGRGHAEILHRSSDPPSPSSSPPPLHPVCPPPISLPYT